MSVPSEPSVHVTVEHSGLDTSHIGIEDFASQQLITEPIEYVGIDHMEEICSMDSPSGNTIVKEENLNFPVSFIIWSHGKCTLIMPN